MGTRNGWFCFMNKLLSRSQKDEDAEKKERRWKWVPVRVKAGRFGELKPPSPQAEEREEFSAAIVARNRCHIGGQARGEEIEDTKTSLKKDSQTQIREAAAVAIQTAFRGYLARKALRALKGIVRLQAIIRGRAVRRQAINTLRCLQSIVNIQSQLRQTRFDATAQPIDASPQYHNLNLFVHKLDSNCQRRWDDSLLSKQDADVSASCKKEAMMRRERIKEYCSIHRRSDESDRHIAKGRWRYWLDQWVDTQLSKSKEVEDLDSIFRSKERQTKVRQSRKQNPNEDMDSPTSSRRRKCLHRKQHSLGDDNSFSGSPIVPAYMAATESARAKARAGRSPKQRQRSFDAYSDSYSPCKNKVWFLGSEEAMGHRSGRSQQGSPSLKTVVTGPVKSARMLKDLTFDSGIFVTSLG